MRFYSKHDSWLGLVLYLPTTFALAQLYREEGLSAFTLMLLFVLAFISWIWFGTYYDINEGILIVRSGPLVGRYSISEIKSVKPSRTWLSSPACSLDRMRLIGDGFNIVISPKDKDGFIERLKSENTSIKIEGYDYE